MKTYKAIIYNIDGIVLDTLKTVVSTLQNKVVQAVVSSNAQYTLDFIDKGLERYIACSILAEDTGHHKPNPEPILACLEKLNIGAKEAIYIGNSTSDYLGAKAAGVDFGYALWGCLTDSMITPDYIFNHPREIYQLVNEDILDTNTIHLVMSDIDGTLLNDDEIMTKPTIESIKQLKKQDKLFGLATGRPICSLEILMKDWGIEEYVDVILGLNGGHIKDYTLGLEEKYFTMDGSLIEMVVNHFDGLPVNFGVYRENYLAVKYDDALAKRLANSDAIPYKVVDFKEIYLEPQSKLIVIVDPNNMQDIINHSKSLKHQDFKCLQAGKIEFEYMHPELSKSYGLSKIAEYHNFTTYNVLMFGDADNDADIVRDAGVGVAMLNGSTKTRGNADFVTLDNNHDGVSQFMNRYITKTN